MFTFMISVPIVWLRGRAKGFTTVEIKTNQDLALNKGAEMFFKILLPNVSIAYNGWTHGKFTTKGLHYNILHFMDALSMDRCRYNTKTMATIAISLLNIRLHWTSWLQMEAGSDQSTGSSREHAKIWCTKNTLPQWKHDNDIFLKKMAAAVDLKTSISNQEKLSGNLCLCFKQC